MRQMYEWLDGHFMQATDTTVNVGAAKHPSTHTSVYLVSVLNAKYIPQGFVSFH